MQGYKFNVGQLLIMLTSPECHTPHPQGHANGWLSERLVLRGPQAHGLMCPAAEQEHPALSWRTRQLVDTSSPMLMVASWLHLADSCPVHVQAHY